MNIQATEVWQWNWNAIHARNPDGSRKYRYIINSGSSRSSKTYSIIQCYYLYAFQNKSKRLSVFRDTKIDCKATVLKDMQGCYPSMPFYNYVNFNKTESIWNFSTGSVIEINGTDEPNRLHGYNGDVTWLCEPYDISKDVFDQLDMRTTEFLIIDLNPKENHWSDEVAKDSRAIVIHSTFRNNKYCPPEQRLKILSYQPVKLSKVVMDKVLSEQQAREYDLLTNDQKLSDLLISELLRCRENERKGSANVFNWNVYGLGLKSERPNRIFSNWEEITDTDYKLIEAKVYYGVDWGVVDPWGVLEAKYYDGALYLHELNYKSENEWRESLDIETLQKTNLVEEGLVKYVFGKLGINKKAYTLCDTNRPLKIVALNESGYDYATTAPKPPGSIIDGINILCGLKVYFTSSSTNLKNECENYSRQVDRYGIVLEEPEDKDNHLMDCARYIALFLSMMGIIKK